MKKFLSTEKNYIFGIETEYVILPQNFFLTWFPMMLRTVQNHSSKGSPN